MPSRKRSDRPIGPAGSIVRPGSAGPRLVNSRGLRWTDAAEAKFLDALAASCNVSHAARDAGFGGYTVYRRRRVDPAFAERWQVALTIGYGRLEELLLQRATEMLDGHAIDPDTPMPPVNFRDALTLLAQHRATVTGPPVQGKTRRARVRGLDEVRASILAKLEAIEAKRRKEVAARSDDPAGGSSDRPTAGGNDGGEA
ncbi:hypothetical protein [Sphingomonas bacterium]|uniref:hypothetical protein n=1 Tax=Sphingomonas bacterium TaxID=1895847 RepID=UPI00157685AC|nr:hypothetical protein [Sphingomonas bacterium]